MGDKQRTKNQKEMNSYPDKLSVLTAGNTVNGSFSAIKVWNAGFPANSTSIKIGGVGVDLSALNSVWVNGDMLLGNFTTVMVPAGSNMVIVVYSG